MVLSRRRRAGGQAKSRRVKAWRGPPSSHPRLRPNRPEPRRFAWRTRRSRGSLRSSIRGRGRSRRPGPSEPSPGPPRFARVSRRLLVVGAPHGEVAQLDLPAQELVMPAFLRSGRLR
jgi:hypothetical protein